ncbi:hypothetical protein Aperf_G00000089850 [Anoplocephala perfoliata]
MEEEEEEEDKKAYAAIWRSLEVFLVNVGIRIGLLCARVVSMPTHIELDECTLSMEKWTASHPHMKENGVAAAAGTWCNDGENDDAFGMYSFWAIHITANLCNLAYDKQKIIIALRVIRVWARSRIIYSSVTGFFGKWEVVVKGSCESVPGEGDSEVDWDCDGEKVQLDG